MSALSCGSACWTIRARFAERGYHGFDLVSAHAAAPGRAARFGLRGDLLGLGLGDPRADHYRVSPGVDACPLAVDLGVGLGDASCGGFGPGLGGRIFDIAKWCTAPSHSDGWLLSNLTVPPRLGHRLNGPPRRNDNQVAAGTAGRHRGIPTGQAGEALHACDPQPRLALTPIRSSSRARCEYDFSVTSQLAPPPSSSH